jgi:Protein of unknown function (DUF4058)
MPVHDWTQVEAGIFHAFHHGWITEISRALNRGQLPRDYYALPEQISGPYGPDVLTLPKPANDKPPRKRRVNKTDRNGAVAVEARPPKAQFHITNEPKWYASKKKSVVVRHITGHRIVAVVEIISPGNKDNKSGLEAFVRKARDLIYGGIHLVLIDLFPRTVRDPEGIHPVIWGDDDGSTYRFNKRKPLTCVSYIGGLGAQAFVYPIGLGDRLPDVPIFLTPFEYVDAPLEKTYKAAFDDLPNYWRGVIGDASKRP